MNNLKYKAVVIGVSAGGLGALSTILPALKPDFPAPIMIVQHIGADADDFLSHHFSRICLLDVVDAEDKMIPAPGHIYFAPANYHLQLEQDQNLSLSTQDKVNYSRPSIDILFETAAEAYGPQLIGIILTGANADGARGLKHIKKLGGLTIVQSPNSAQVETMPRAAIKMFEPDMIIPLEDIAPTLNELV